MCNCPLTPRSDWHFFERTCWSVPMKRVSLIHTIIATNRAVGSDQQSRCIITLAPALLFSLLYFITYCAWCSSFLSLSLGFGDAVAQRRRFDGNKCQRNSTRRSGMGTPVQLTQLQVAQWMTLLLVVGHARVHKYKFYGVFGTQLSRSYSCWQ